MLTPTPEQLAIIRFAREDKRSLLVNALAGSAKTTTLVMIAQALPIIPVLCLAFNKRIADEMGKRMPSHIKCQTLNSLGHGVWSRVTGKRLAVDTGKTYGFLKEEIEQLRGEDKTEVREAFGSILRGVAMAKTAGFVPKSYRGITPGLVTDEQLYDVLAPALDDEPTSLIVHVINNILERSIKAGYGGFIDFDDQIYLPTLFGDSFPRYPVVMVDEAQDLSPLNHATLSKMRPGRLIAVGDPWQSIYKFRGADQYSMRNLKSAFAMEELTLSISFRCPIEGVKRAHARVPHMRWWDTAIQGEVIRLDRWEAKDVPESATVLCRNNAPLFGCALRFIRAGRGVTIVGRELGPGLVKILMKLGPASMPRDRVFIAIKVWEVEMLRKAGDSRRGMVIEKADCLRIFADFGNNLGEACDYAEHLFKADGQIKLMTGHKAKGLEFDDVLILDSWRIPSKYARIAADRGDHSLIEQEWNLQYVMDTRWKKRLYLADLERMQ